MVNLRRNWLLSEVSTGRPKPRSTSLTEPSKPADRRSLTTMDLFHLPASLRRSLISTLRIPSTIYTRTLATKSTSQPQPETHLKLSSSTLNSYTTSNPPTTDQLHYASRVFQRASPHLLFTAYYFRSFPPSQHPEVAFLGRSNVGKSSLLNALFGRPSERPAHVSKKPGKTRTMNGFGVGGQGMSRAPLEGEREVAWKRFGRGGAVVVDMPGYGGGSREEWGKEALKYLTGRKQLRRTFVLIDAEHGLKSSDVTLLTHLRGEGVPFTVVLSKVDKLLYPTSKLPTAGKLSGGLQKLRETCEKVRAKLREAYDDGRPVTDDILCVSAEKSLDEKSRFSSKLGIDELRWAILNAAGLEGDEKGARKRQTPRAMKIDILDDEVKSSGQPADVMWKPEA